MNAAQPQRRPRDIPDAFVPSEAGYRRALQYYAPRENRAAGLRGTWAAGINQHTGRRESYLEAHVSAWLRDHPASSRDEIAAGLACNTRTLCNVLRVMVAKGKIDRLPRAHRAAPYRYEVAA